MIEPNLEDDIKDQWDEDSEESEDLSDEEESNVGTQSISIPKKKTKNLKEKIAEKEKIETQKSIESSSLPKSTDTNTVNGTFISIDSFEPSTKDDFEKLRELIKNKLSKFEQNPNYIVLLENLFKNLSDRSDADDVKKLLTTINAMSNEKSKLIKGAKPKKKPKKVSLMSSKTNDLGQLADLDYDDGDDYDDFM